MNSLLLQFSVQFVSFPTKLAARASLAPVFFNRVIMVYLKENEAT